MTPNRKFLKSHSSTYRRDIDAHVMAIFGGISCWEADIMSSRFEDKKTAMLDSSEHFVLPTLAAIGIQ